MLVEIKKKTSGFMWHSSSGSHARTKSNGGTLGEMQLSVYDNVIVIEAEEIHNGHPSEYKIAITVDREKFDEMVKEYMENNY